MCRGRGRGAARQPVVKPEPQYWAPAPALGTVLPSAMPLLPQSPVSLHLVSTRRQIVPQTLLFCYTTRHTMQLFSKD